MPYDPNWDLEKGGGTDSNNTGVETEDIQSSLDDDWEGMPVEEVEDEDEQQGDYVPSQEVYAEAEDMEVDTPARYSTQNVKSDPDATLRSHVPFPGAVGVGKSAQLEVVLHSSPKKDAFDTPADTLEDGYDDSTNLVTSDLLSKPRNRQPEIQAPKTQIVPPTTQPSSVPTPLPTVTPQPKRRGRPVGWRAGQGSYSAMRSGLLPGSTPQPKPKKPASEHKVRRRPGRNPVHTARQIYLKLEPHFLTFRCEWENCPAELQNIETLRKHLLVVHGRPPSPASSPSSPPTTTQPPSITCKWSTCTSPPLPSLSSFTTHIDTAHLLPYRWHLGDGPRNTTPSSLTTTTSKNPLPSYLFSPQGHQVTPSIATQLPETDDDRKRRQARINRVLLQRDQNAPEEPEYTARELAVIGEVMGEKKARQRMLREYAERVERGEGMEGWRVR